MESVDEQISLRILNLSEDFPGASTSLQRRSKNVAEDLRLKMLRLVSDHLDESTGTTNFLVLANTDEFKRFEKISEELIHCNPALLDGNELKAFFINIYNILTWHALAVYHREMKISTPVESVLNIHDFWVRFGYKIGEHSFSLDDIEHGILRGNLVHPSSQKKAFAEDDPRRKLALTSVDPRIHFALNCGAKSCPMVRVYSSENLDQKLDDVAKSYLQQEVSVEGGDILVLPQILEWYGSDFASTESGVLRWLLNYTGGRTREVIESLVKGNSEERSKGVRYFYNWALSQKA